MEEHYCRDCGTVMIRKEVEREGLIPYCPKCGKYHFPVYNVAVSMIVINEADNRILLIKQYGKPYYILVAGYVTRTENLEHAAAREIHEETGMTVSRIRFNRSKFFEPSDTLMCNFTAYVPNDNDLNPNEEIDSLAWFTFEEARKQIKQGSLAAEFLNAYLDEASEAEENFVK